jgi:serine protease
VIAAAFIAAPPPPVAAAPASQAPRPDPQAPAQRHLSQIGWTPPPAGGRRPLVAVLDTGVDAGAPDLAAAIAPGGRSFLPGRRDAGVDPDGHGTHVAGIIAALSGNGIGGSGVAAARILPVVIADGTGTTTTTSLVRGVRYAAARGARVINISFGGRGFSRVEQEAIDSAVRQGALVVAAAGNSGAVGAAEYPGAYRHVLAVGALGRSGRPLAISARGPQVAIAAPGEDILSTAPRALAGRSGEGLVARTGTSMAAAVVSGAAARIIARRPGLSAERVWAILVGMARDVPPAGPDPGTGAGALDLAAALAAPPPPPEDPEPNDDTRLAARTPPLLSGRGPSAVTVAGAVGSHADPRDGFRVVLRAGQTLTAELAGPAGVDLDLALWRPGTPARRRDPAFARAWLSAASLGPSSDERLTLTAPAGGVYTLEVQGADGTARYTLTARRGP